jgi:hypothetical protein
MTTPTTTELHPALEPTGHDSFADDLAPAHQPLRELDSRSGDGLTITLLWRPGDSRVTVRIDDHRTAVRVEFGVPGRDARDAFAHPYAYAG